MGWSGLIYAAIVAGWAAVLVPRWVRRNEEAERARAADVLAGIRVLERRNPDALGNGARRQVLHAPHPPTLDLPPRPRPADPDHVAGARRVPTPPPRRVARAAAMRRRRVFTLLAAVLVATATTVVAGVLSTLALAVPATLLAGFGVVARRAVRREAQALARVRIRQARYATGAQVSRPRRVIPRATAMGADDRSDRLSQAGPRLAIAGAQHPGVREGEVGLPTAAAPGATVADGPIADDLDDTDSWAPVPVPLPTYVTAPKAPRVIRRIDLSSCQAWTSGGVGQGDAPTGRQIRTDGASADDAPAAGFPELPPVLAATSAGLDTTDEPDTTTDDSDEGYDHRRAVGD
ncbi:MAG TPA: hypothetical protein VK908_07550 [Jiangellales bacterium]|nr:hypothetical protein [Jiangellales bacterium]